MKTLGSIRLVLFLPFFTTIAIQAENAIDRWYLRDARVVNKVRFVGGIFIGVGNNGTILTSTNGQTWTARNSGTTANLKDVSFGHIPSPPGTDSKYVAVGTGGTILISVNAIDWITVATTNTLDLNDVVHGNSRFIATTTRFATNQPNAFSSFTGTTWSPIIFPNSSGSWTHSAISVGATFVAAVGDGLGDQVWRSIGGGTWQNPGLFSLAVRDIAYGNGQFIAFGFESAPKISTDLGQTWFATDTNWCVFYGNCLQGNAITFGNSTFVAAIYPNSGLATTTNGAVWTKGSALSGTGVGSLAFGYGTFIASTTNGIYQSEPVSTPGLTINRPSTNTLHLTASGEVGRAYRLQTSTNLSDWSDHFPYTNTLPTMEFVEPVTNNSPLYYRAVAP